MRYDSNLERKLDEYHLQMFVNGELCELNNYDPVNDVMTGRKFVIGDVITIKPLSGYELMETGNRYSDFMFVFDFTISGDKKSGELTFNEYMADGDRMMGGFEFATKVSAVVIPPDDENPIDNIKKGVNNIYLLDADTTRKVLKDSFAVPISATDAITYSDGIIGLINIPFPIDDKYKLLETFVMIGNFNTNLKGRELSTDTIIVNMGSIEVPMIDNDLTDYEGVKVVLNLPYSEPIQLQAVDVMGYTIKLEYWVNVYNGECVINIYSTKTNRIIEVKKVDLKVDVPFNRVNNTPQRNGFNAIDSTGYNGVNTAYIEVKKYDVILKNGVYTNPIIDEKTLTDERGFIEVENIELSFNGTLDEKDKIFNLLRNGVIIK